MNWLRVGPPRQIVHAVGESVFCIQRPFTHIGVDVDADAVLFGFCIVGNIVAAAMKETYAPSDAQLEGQCSLFHEAGVCEVLVQFYAAEDLLINGQRVFL